MNDQHITDLADLFACHNGCRVQNADDWRQRRLELRERIVPIEYGGLPPTPAGVTGELLHAHQSKLLGPDVWMYQYRVVNQDHPAFHFRLDLYAPAREDRGPFPVVLSGDGCYRFANEALPTLLARGCMLAQFSRVEIVPDVYNSNRDQGLYLAYPDHTFGALAAWAWGFHRCVDVLCSLAFVDKNRIAVTGHSRGGKAALLAGATDERIALTAPNGSGAGGAAAWGYRGPESENLAGTMTSIPYWFGPQMKAYLGREAELPFDQHFLAALVAPRALLSTEGLDDLWSNPRGTYQTYAAAREVYRFLGAENRIGIHFRPGGHNQGPADWKAFLDFMAWQFQTDTPPCRYDTNPYPDMAPAFAWAAPPTTL